MATLLSPGATGKRAVARQKAAVGVSQMMSAWLKRGVLAFGGWVDAPTPGCQMVVRAWLLKVGAA